MVEISHKLLPEQEAAIKLIRDRCLQPPTHPPQALITSRRMPSSSQNRHREREALHMPFRPRPTQSSTGASTPDADYL